MFLIINKPKGITSHDVVDKLRKITGIKKIGHAGTLDPNATGLLVIGIGRQSTKQLGSIAKDTQKTYQAEITLGEERDTDDTEGKVVKKQKISNKLIPTAEKVMTIINEFVGKKLQTPPIYSAIKVKGKKAYELARKNKKVVLAPREIQIYSIKLTDYQYPKIKITVTVSSGTYIRSLARDVGRFLGTGAYLSNLKRTRIGNFEIINSHKLDKITPDNWQSLVV